MINIAIKNNRNIALLLILKIKRKNIFTLYNKISERKRDKKEKIYLFYIIRRASDKKIKK